MEGAEPLLAAGAEPLLAAEHVAVSVVAFIGLFEKESERQWVCVDVSHTLIPPPGSVRVSAPGLQFFKIAGTLLALPVSLERR